MVDVLQGRTISCAWPQLAICILTTLIHSRLGWVLYSVLFTTAQAIGVINSGHWRNGTIYAVSENGQRYKYRKDQNNFETAFNELTPILVKT